jgi:hypothetical protein
VYSSWCRREAAPHFAQTLIFRMEELRAVASCIARGSHGAGGRRTNNPAVPGSGTERGPTPRVTESTLNKYWWLKTVHSLCTQIVVSPSTEPNKSAGIRYEK